MKTKINGKTYELYRDEQRMYNGYFYKNEITERQPLDTHVIGYVIEEKTKVAICRKSYRKLYPLLYSLLGVSSVAVIALAIVAITYDVDVVHWVPGKSGDDVVGVLDDGVLRGQRGLKYSQYVTYSNGSLALYVDGRANADVSVTVGNKTSEYVSVLKCYDVPMDLELDSQEIVEGILNYRANDTVTTYPLIIEHLDTVKPELAPGTIMDNKEAHDTITKPTTSDSILADPTPPEQTEDSVLADKSPAIDYENFDIIEFKDPDAPPDPQDMEDLLREGGN